MGAVDHVPIWRLHLHCWIDSYVHIIWMEARNNIDGHCGGDGILEILNQKLQEEQGYHGLKAEGANKAT